MKRRATGAWNPDRPAGRVCRKLWVPMQRSLAQGPGTGGNSPSSPPVACSRTGSELIDPRRLLVTRRARLARWWYAAPVHDQVAPAVAGVSSRVVVPHGPAGVG
jgi:hypothetical protein